MYAQKTCQVQAGRLRVMEKHFPGFLAGETLKGARRRCSPGVFTERAA